MKKLLKVMITAFVICAMLAGCASDKPAASPKSGEDSSETGSTLIESDKEQGYYKYKANVPVNFDIDMDGKDEEIKYDSAGGKLSIAGYEALEIDTTFTQKDYFIVIEFKDRFGTEMNMVGIVDYGPSSDPTTTVYSIIEPMGEKSFVSVGTVPGEIVPFSQYSEDNIDDFNYKAVTIMGQGIDAPVRMSILPHTTWFGRNLFTYYTTDNGLIDNKNKYEYDYVTKMELTVEKHVVAYSVRDVNSETVIIKAGQKVKLQHTDNEEWIDMMAEDGATGYVQGKDVTMDNFSGFPVVD